MELENLFRKKFNKKRVFVTGHTGFKGAWLVGLLNYLGASIKGYSLPPQKKSLYLSIDGDKLCNSVLGDVRDEKKLSAEIKKYNPDFIFHLAAQSLVRSSYQKPLYTYQVNAIGTANVLHAFTQLKKKSSLVIVTTDKVYENQEKNNSFIENDRLGGYDPYSASKVCAEIITDSFQKSYRVKNKGIASARAGNVIGGGDWSENRIIPDIIKSLANNKPVILRNPSSTRPWQHVLDVLNGYLLLAEKLDTNPEKYSSSYNFGPTDNKTVSVEELTKIAIFRWGKGNYKVKKDISAPHEFDMLQLNSSKAIKDLNWKPKWNTTISIKKTMEWYNDVLTKKASPLSCVKQQIQTYFDNCHS